jgi:hypothetical protein
VVATWGPPLFLLPPLLHHLYLLETLLQSSSSSTTTATAKRHQQRGPHLAPLLHDDCYFCGQWLPWWSPGGRTTALSSSIVDLLFNAAATCPSTREGIRCLTPSLSSLPPFGGSIIGGIPSPSNAKHNASLSSLHPPPL